MEPLSASNPETSSGPAKPQRGYYTPGRVAYWLANWDLLASLAESPATSRHHLGPERPGPTPVTPRVGARQPGYHGDPLAWADVLADMQRAIASISDSLERRAILGRTQGYTFGQMAQLFRCRKATVLEAFHSATSRMAELLDPGQAPDTKKDPPPVTGEGKHLVAAASST